MDDKLHQRFILQDRSFASLAKRDLQRMAEKLGFSATDVGKLNIIVAELISNLLKHTPQGGELLAKPIGEEGIEIICFDQGPGMSDTHRMMRDGTSTSGTFGEGLGAIKRLSSEFDIYAQPGLGTVILSRLYKAPVTDAVLHPAKKFKVAAVMVAKTFEKYCGDNFAVIENGNDCYLIVLDGLGHGVNANEASSLAVRTFEKNYALEPCGSLRLIHDSIRKTRGAVGSVVHISTTKNEIAYCGIGNISGKLYSGYGANLSNVASRNLISYNGTIGHNIPNTFHLQRIDWSGASLLVMHSDGIKTRWDLGKYPNLHRHDPSIIAAVIFRDYCRQTDDSLVLVAQQKI